MLSPKTLAFLAQPLKLVKHKSTMIERLIDIKLGESEFDRIRDVCSKTGYRIGNYYFWYLQKYLVKKRLKGVNRKSAMALIGQMDHTNYACLERLMPKDAGVLVAIPHHGHYIFSIIALVSQIFRDRRVHVFYGNPETHPGNEIFDALYEVTFGGNPVVGILHDTRVGLAKALRALKDGDVVILLPDVYENIDFTVAIPFCGRWMNVMQGSAMLARKTGATILPMVSLQKGCGMGFSTWFGSPIVGDGASADSRSIDVIVGDYRATREMFAQFERVMAPELMHWQFVRQHMRKPELAAMPGPNSLPVWLSALASEVDLYEASQVVDLRPLST